MQGTSASHIGVLPEDSRFAALLEIPEDQWFDRKSARVAPRDLAPLLVAFATAEGGTIAIGVHDGRYDGQLLNPDRENALRQVAMDHTVPPVRMETEKLVLGDDQSILLLHIRPGEQVNETSKGDAFLRVGDETRKLGFNQRRELAYDRGSAQFEGEAVPGANEGALDHDQLQRYREAIGADADNSTALRARSLLTRTGDLTVAGLLLLGHHPQERFPQALVRVMRFAERDPGTGSRQTLESGKDRRFEDPIPNVLDQAAECIARWMPKRRALGASRRFEEMREIGLVDPLYEQTGGSVRLTLTAASRLDPELEGQLPAGAEDLVRLLRQHGGPSALERSSSSPGGPDRGSGMYSKLCGMPASWPGREIPPRIPEPLGGLSIGLGTCAHETTRSYSKKI